MKEKKLLSALVIGALVGTMTLVTSNSVKASDSTGITVKLTGNGDGSSWTYSNGYADASMDHKLNLGKNGNIPTKTDYDEEAYWDRGTKGGTNAIDMSGGKLTITGFDNSNNNKTTGEITATGGNIVLSDNYLTIIDDSSISEAVILETASGSYLNVMGGSVGINTGDTINGTVNASSGTLTVSGPHNLGASQIGANATFSIKDNATVTFGNGFNVTINEGDSVGGNIGISDETAGTLTFAGGGHNINDSVIGNAVNLSVTGGAVGFNSASNIHTNFTNNGNVDLKGGTLGVNITGTGTTEIRGNVNMTDTSKSIGQDINITNGSFTANGANIGGAVTNAVNNGLVLTGGNLTKNVTGAGSTKIDTTGTVTNTASIQQAVNVVNGTFNNTTGSVSGLTTISNGATAKQSGVGSLGAVYNAGTLEVSNGTVTSVANTASGTQGVKQSGGTVTSVNNTGVYNLTGGTVTNYTQSVGNLNISNGASLTVSNGTNPLTSAVNAITGGTVNLGNASSIGSLTINNGLDTNKAKVVTNGASVLNIQNGAFTTQAETNIGNDAAVTIGTASGTTGKLNVSNGTVALGNNDTWNAKGEVNVNGGTLNLNGVTQSGKLTQTSGNGTTNVLSNQTFGTDTTITNGTLNIGDGAGTNDTTLTVTGGTITAGSSNAKVVINSDSIMDIKGGTVTLDGGSGDHGQVDWKGTVKLENGGSLILSNIYDSLRTTTETKNKTGILNAEGGNLTINSSTVLLGNNDVIAQAVNLTLAGNIVVNDSANAYIDSSDTWTAGNITQTGGTLSLDGVSTAAAKTLNSNGGTLNVINVVTLATGDDTIATGTTVNIASGNTLNIQNTSANGVTIDNGDTWEGAISLSGGNLNLNGRYDTTTATHKYNQAGGVLNLITSKLKLGTSDSKIAGGTVNVNSGSELTFDNGTSNNAVVKSDANTSNKLTVGGDTTTTELTLNSGSDINAGTDVIITSKGTLNSVGTQIKGDSTKGITNDGIFNLTNEGDTAGTIARAINNAAGDGTTGTVNLTGITESTANGRIDQANVKVGDGSGTAGSDTSVFTMGANVTANTKLTVAQDGKIVNSANNIVAEAIDVATGGSIVGNGTTEGNLTVRNGGSNAGTITQNNVTLTAGTLDNTGTLTANGTFTNHATITDSTGNGTLHINGGGSSDKAITQKDATVTGATAFNNNADLTATNSLNNSGTINNTSNITVKSTSNNASLINTGIINSTANSTITADTLTNTDGTMNLTKAQVAIVYQADDIKGIINVLGSDDSTDKTDLSITGTKPNFAGNLNVGNNTNNATLNLLSGNIVEEAITNIASGSVLNVDDSSGAGTSSVVIDGNNDTYAGDITLASGAVTMKDLTVKTGDTSTTAGGTLPYYEQTGGALTLTNSTLSMVDSSKIGGGDLTVDTNSTFNSLSKAFSVDNLTNAGLINGINGGYKNYAVSTGFYAGDALGDKQGDFTTDLYARSNTNKNYDKYGSDSATIYASDPSKHGILNVSDWTLNGDIYGWDAPIDRNISMDKLFKGSVATGHTIDFTVTDKEVFTPIGWYGLHSKGGGNFSFDLNRFNPGVFRGQVSKIAQYQNQLMIDDILFSHTMLDQGFKGNDYIASNPNRFASATDLYPPYQYSRKDGGLWVKAYGIFENLQMNVGKIGNNAYGTIIGADFGLKELKHGWQFMPTAYIAYNGAHQYWKGYGAYQNGGQAGFMGTFYKNNWIIGALAYGGVYNNNMDTPRGNDDTLGYFGGGAVKTAYNWNFAKNWSLQPNLLVSYNYFGKENWHTDFGQMSMMSGQLHGINIAPGLNLIWEKETFSIYGTIQYMYNVNQSVGGRAGNVDLPNVHMDRGYIQYGLGFNKRFGDRFNGFLQAVIRNVGRTGIGLQAGFQWQLGKGSSNNNTKKGNITPELKKTEITLNGNRVQ